MVELPCGTVTLVFTDMESSTRLLASLGSRYEAVLADHLKLLRTAFSFHEGIEVDTRETPSSMPLPKPTTPSPRRLRPSGRLPPMTSGKASSSGSAWASTRRADRDRGGLRGTRRPPREGPGSRRDQSSPERGRRASSRIPWPWRLDRKGESDGLASELLSDGSRQRGR